MTYILPVKETIAKIKSSHMHYGHTKRHTTPHSRKFHTHVKNNIVMMSPAKIHVNMQAALNFIYEQSYNGRDIIFVATKRRAVDITKKHAQACEAFFVCHRWIGGLLTNNQVITQAIEKYSSLKKQYAADKPIYLIKKEIAKQERILYRLDRYYLGLVDMQIKNLGCLCVLDAKYEHQAIAEANKVGIPVVCLVDTNSSTKNIDYVVPGNDDSLLSISYYFDSITKCINQAKADKQNAK